MTGGRASGRPGDESAAATPLRAVPQNRREERAWSLRTVVTMASRHFKRSKREGDNEPKHPAVKFVLAA